MYLKGVLAISFQACSDVPISIRLFGCLCNRSSCIDYSFLSRTSSLSVPHAVVGRLDQKPHWCAITHFQTFKNFVVLKPFFFLMACCGAKTLILKAMTSKMHIFVFLSRWFLLCVCVCVCVCVFFVGLVYKYIIIYIYVTMVK